MRHIFRLRIDAITVGYKEIFKKNHHFYSTDLYGWTNCPIEYLDKDKSIGLYDKNQQMLFENDICIHKKTGATIACLFKKNSPIFIDCDLLTQINPDDIIHFCKELKRIAFLLQHPSQVEVKEMLALL